MSIGSILSWIACGLVVGVAARFLVPGLQRMSLPMTTGLGIVGSLMGGFGYSVIRGPSVEPFLLTSQNWYGWIVAILGAMALLATYTYLYPRRWWS